MVNIPWITRVLAIIIWCLPSRVTSTTSLWRKSFRFLVWGAWGLLTRSRGRPIPGHPYRRSRYLVAPLKSHQTQPPSSHRLWGRGRNGSNWRVGKNLKEKHIRFVICALLMGHVPPNKWEFHFGKYMKSGYKWGIPPKKGNIGIQWHFCLLNSITCVCSLFGTIQVFCLFPWWSPSFCCCSMRVSSVPRSSFGTMGSMVKMRWLCTQVGRCNYNRILKGGWWFP